MALARYLRIASLPIQEANEEKRLEDLREKVRAKRKDSDEIMVHLTH